MKKWIIVDRYGPGGDEEEAAGSVHADGAGDALTKARSWPGLKDPANLRAILWESASEEMRSEAAYEDSIRGQLNAAGAAPATAVLMMGLTTAFIADYPALERVLVTGGITALTKEQAGKLLLYYAVMLYEACRRTSARLLSADVHARLVRGLQAELPRLLSAGAEGEMPVDDWIALTDALAPQLGPSDPNEPAFTLEFGRLAAAIVGVADDPEFIGRAAVSARSTLNRLRLSELIATAEPV